LIFNYISAQALLELRRLNMASAKNKKKAVATKKVIKKPAPKKPAPKKAEKPVAKKPAKKVTVKKVVKKAATAKPSAKKTAAKIPAKKADLKKAVKDIASKAPAKKEISKPVATKTTAKTPVKTEKILKKDIPAAPPKKEASKENLKAKKQEVEKKAAGKAGKPGEMVDPLHAKAAKVMKELEETMDLSLMRPRIQAGTAPKPLAKKVEPLPILPEPTNTNKEKYTLEFEFRSSPKILFTSLSDSSGLAGWFADEVHVKDKLYTFAWEGGHSNARLVAIRDLQLIRFEWEEDTDGTYFQFEIKEDDITMDVALIITDFAVKGEKDTNIRLWESQVQKLRMLLGSL
jgi:uncharacterized protein YndB with AHSA1/START domain